tara:strand:+ start:1166 stop:2014 length:849 start_codon:yes stop_codon:yes gene_type:complete
MNKRSRKEFFDEHGYFIEKNAFNTGDMESLFEVFYDLSWNVAIRNKIDLSKKILPTNKIQYPRDLKQLDHLMLDIFNYNKDLLGEIYDTFSYSSAFMRFLGNEKVESMAKELLGLPNYTTLYGWTNRVRIDPPRDERRTYGWHQEIFYTFPKTRFVQTWCPILRDTTIDNGTIEIKPYSHKEGIPKQTWTEEEGKAPQIIIDKSILDKYKTVQLEMKVGDLLFFNGHLAHQSGNNSTKDEIRFSLVGMWNDTSYRTFRPPRPNFQSRIISAKQHFKNIFEDS